MGDPEGGTSNLKSVSSASSPLASRVRQGVQWKIASQGTSLILQLATAVVLARLLSPEEFGLAAMVLVFRRLLFLFSDFAFTPALVQRRHLTDKDRSTAFWSSLILGAFATIIGIGIAGWVAAFFGEPSVKPLYIVFSFGFLVLAFGSTQAALLTRELAYRSLELRNIVGTVVGTAVAIALAWRGYGAWAIIGQMLATMTVSTLLVWQLSAWRPAFTFSRTSLRGLAGFSSQVLGTQIVTAVISNLDNLLVGKFLGATALGAYRLSYNLVIFPLSNLAVPIAQVLFPAFSRMQGDRTRMANAWIRATRVVLAVMCPIFIVLLVGAPTLVPVILGSRWDAAIPVIQILSWLGMLQSLRGLNTAVLQACGQPGTLLRIALLGLPIYAAGFVAGLEWGITGVAAGAAAAATIIQPLYTIAAARAVEIEARRVVFASGRVIVLALIVLALTFGTRELLEIAGAGQTLQLVAIVVCAVTTYVVVLWRGEPDVVAEVRWLRGRRRQALDRMAV